MSYTGYPRKRLNNFLPLTAPNVSYDTDASYPQSLKVDGGVTALPIMGGSYSDSEVANGAAITADQVKQVGVDVSNFAKLRGTIRSDKAVTVTVWQNPVRYNGNLHWLAKTDIAVSASTAQGGGADVNVDLKGGRFRITVTNAGAPTTDLARIFPALYLSKV